MAKSSSGKSRRDRAKPQGGWCRDAMIMLHIGYNTTDKTPVGKGVNVEETARLINLSAPDVLQIHARGAAGWTTYPSRVGYTPPKLRRDVLRLWRDMATEMGKPFSAYYNLGRDGEIMRRRPEFNRLNAGGVLEDMMLCYHSGVAEEYLWPQIREIIDAYKPDGFWFDGTCWIVRVCYCDKCRALWQERYGTQMPRSPDEPGWDALKEMQREIYRRFVHETLRMIHERWPECVVGINIAFTAIMPEKPVPEIDYLTIDHANGAEYLGLHTSFMDAQGKPFDIMTAAWYKDGKELKPKPDEHLQQEAATILSRGQGRLWIWDFPNDAPGLVEERQTMLARVVPWVRTRQVWCKNTHNLPDVSILHSVASYYAEHRSSNACFPHHPENLRKIMGTLDARRVLYEAIADWRLLEDSVRGKLLLVEDPYVLPGELLEAMGKYVEGGGRLLVTGRAAVTGGPALRRLAGLKQADLEPILAPWQLVSADTDEMVAQAMMSGLYGVEPSDAQVLLWAKREQESKRVPFLTMTRRGKGQVFFCSATVFSAEPTQGSDAIRNQWIDSVLANALPESLRSVRLDGPNSVQLAYRSRDNLRIVHLVNRAPGERTGDDWLFVRIVNIPPVPACRLFVSSPVKPEKVTLEPDGRSVKWHYKDGRLEVEVPEFAIYEMVVIETPKDQIVPKHT